MITLPGLAAEALGAYLAADMKDRFGSSHARLAELIPFAARLALECIGNSDALYHNVEHTMLVTLAGHEIFKGRALLVDSTPEDYSHFIVGCLAHDIGYVRGIFAGDGDDGYVIDDAGHKVELPRGGSDAGLAPHHVDRSKLFVLERFAKIEELDEKRIANAIEHTRFPYSLAESPGITEEAALLRAADLIGQLGDPHYLKKSNALFHEFEECGLNKQFGYDSPGRPDRQISAVLLAVGFPLHSGRDPVPQCDVGRAAVDQRSLQQRLPRRARPAPLRAAIVGRGGAPVRRSDRRKSRRTPKGGSP